MSVDFQALVATLNPHCRAALERAAQRCVQQSHFHIEVEHLLLELLDGERHDLHWILPRFALERSALEQELLKTQEGFKRGNVRPPSFGTHTITLLQEAWVQTSLFFKEKQVRSAAIVLALVEHESLRELLLSSASSFMLIGRDTLRKGVREWVADSAEQAVHAGPAPGSRHAAGGIAAPGGAGPAAGHAPARSHATPTPALDQYARDLTEAARAGDIDPIYGRDGEIRQVIDILLRRRQNNPILVGAPGVGKTAVAEGLALRIAAGDVPPPLREVSLRVLDLALLQAGAGIKGEFEQRLKTLIEEVRTANRPIILFIDEAHTMIGAGGDAGQGDAANLLKPALARGELRTLAATTWAEYKQYIEKDPALARRFQLVQVEEPSEAVAVGMLRGIATQLERHHSVSIEESAIHDAVRLTHRYLPGRQLPDKAISVLDTACARVALGQHDTPPQIEAARHRQQAIEDELQRLRFEQRTGADHAAQIRDLEQECKGLDETLARLTQRWEEERLAVHEIVALRARLRAADGANGATGAYASDSAGGHDAAQRIEGDDGEDSTEDIALLVAQLARLESGLNAIRQDEVMVPICVDSRTVADVVAGWTGIPVGKMLADESLAIRSLHERLAQRVVGQDDALALIANRIKTYRAGLTDPDKPVGVFLLLGPSGVGKTETAYALADALYGGDRSLVAINLSEYQEAHTISQLKGAPPGYVGYGSGGVLTEAVRRKPYCVVLLDEFEKAHPDVLEAFYNVFDKGMMEDGTGLQVDFRNTVILATSNAAAELIVDACHGRNGEAPSALQTGNRALVDLLQPVLSRMFKPALLARMAITPYRPLGEEQVRRIVQLKLTRVEQRVRKVDPDFPGFDDGTVDWVMSRLSASGAREIERVIMDELVVGLVDDILDRQFLPD